MTLLQIMKKMNVLSSWTWMNPVAGYLKQSVKKKGKKKSGAWAKIQFKFIGLKINSSFLLGINKGFFFLLNRIKSFVVVLLLHRFSKPANVAAVVVQSPWVAKLESPMSLNLLK